MKGLYNFFYTGGRGGVNLILFKSPDWILWFNWGENYIKNFKKKSTFSHSVAYIEIANEWLSCFLPPQGAPVKVTPPPHPPPPPSSMWPNQWPWGGRKRVSLRLGWPWPIHTKPQCMNTVQRSMGMVGRRERESGRESSYTVNVLHLTVYYF